MILKMGFIFVSVNSFNRYLLPAYSHYLFCTCLSLPLP